MFTDYLGIKLFNNFLIYLSRYVVLDASGRKNLPGIGPKIDLHAGLTNVFQLIGYKRVKSSRSKPTFPL